MWSRLRGSILFQAILFSVPFQGTLFTVNGFLKGKNGGESLTARANFGSKLEDSQWIQDRKYKGVLKINSLGCSGFSVTSRDLSAGAKIKRLRQAVEEHPYRFTIHCCSRLYSSSQKLIDCLTIGESPYYLLQPDARCRVVTRLPRILGASTNSSTNTEWSGSVTPLQSAGKDWNAPFDSNNGSQQEEKDQFKRRDQNWSGDSMWSRLRGSILFQAVLFSVPSQGTLFSVNGFLKGKNGGESLAARANFESKLRVLGKTEAIAAEVSVVMVNQAF
uniref:Predicted protein n=1 Tax=Physcomitrium patens TaxID=3218 RepID=A9U3N1_PHYPA